MSAKCCVCGCGLPDSGGDYSVDKDGDLLCTPCWMMAIVELWQVHRHFWEGQRVAEGRKSGFGMWFVTDSGEITMVSKMNG